MCFFFKQKTAYEWRISDWSSDVCSSDLTAEKAALLRRLDLPEDALPHLGSWKADTRFLTHIVDAIEALRPAVVVELGCGASSLFIARALSMFGGGRLISYDPHQIFVHATAPWHPKSGGHARPPHAPPRPPPRPRAGPGAPP